MTTFLNYKLQNGSFAKEKFSALSLANAIKNHLNEYFSGISKASVNIDEDKEVIVSVSLLAYFLKYMLQYIDQSSFSTVHMSITDDYFAIKISESKSISFSNEELRVLLQCAKQAGFIIRIESDRILLETAVIKESNAVFAVYARDMCDIEEIFKKIFELD